MLTIRSKIDFFCNGSESKQMAVPLFLAGNPLSSARHLAIGIEIDIFHVIIANIPKAFC